MDEQPDTTIPTATDNSSVLLNMESMIKSLISSIDRLGDELDKNKGMLDAIFEQDQTYQEHAKLAKEAAQVKAGTKAQILKQPQAAELNNKVKTIKSEIAEQQTSLSDYLGEYQRMSGIDQIEGEDGEMRKIVYVAKLVRGT